MVDICQKMAYKTTAASGFAETGQASAVAALAGTAAALAADAAAGTRARRFCLPCPRAR